MCVYLIIYTHTYIYICVCKLCNICTNVKLLLLQGPWALGWHGPTKAHPSCCANVPAILFSDRHGTGLSREPLHEKSCLIACYGIQFLTDHYNDPVLVCVSVCVCYISFRPNYRNNLNGSLMIIGYRTSPTKTPN